MRSIRHRRSQPLNGQSFQQSKRVNQFSYTETTFSDKYWFTPNDQQANNNNTSNSKGKNTYEPSAPKKVIIQRIKERLFIRENKIQLFNQKQLTSARFGHTTANPSKHLQIARKSLSNSRPVSPRFWSNNKIEAETRVPRYARNLYNIPNIRMKPCVISRMFLSERPQSHMKGASKSSRYISGRPSLNSHTWRYSSIELDFPHAGKLHSQINPWMDEEEPTLL